MADLEKHERGDDRPPSAYRRAAPVAPFPEYAPPPGMDRTRVIVLLVVGSAALLGAWLGLHGPGGADPGGVAAPSPAGRPGALAGAGGPALGDAGPRIGSGASAPRTGRDAPRVRERHQAGRTRDARSGHPPRPGEGHAHHTTRRGGGQAHHTTRPGGGHAHHTAGRGGDGARHATVPGPGSYAPNPAAQDREYRAGRAAGRREDARATRQDRENRPRHAAARHEPVRTGHVRTDHEAGAGAGTPAHRSPRSAGERPSRPAPGAEDRRPVSPGRHNGKTTRRPGATEDRPAPRATSRGPAGPGLLHQWCEDNFTTAPLLARACHLYVTP